MRITFVAAAFGLAVLAVACGGGGSSPVVPGVHAGPNGPNLPTYTSRTMMLKIPPAAQQSHARKPFYISPNTESIAVAVLQNATVGETPNPASAQVFALPSPTACPTPGPNGTCYAITAQVPFGEDEFYVATFNVPSPSASTIPLAAFESGAILISSPSPGATPAPLDFTMNGVVNSVVITVPSPDPSNTPNTQVFAAGVASSAQTLAITPYDVSGSAILADAFDGAITVTVSPAPAGVGLSIAATCPGASVGLPVVPPAASATKRRAFTGSPSIQILCAADLGNVTFGYDGTITPDTSDHITDTFKINASQIASPVPANVVLASNVVTYPLSTAGNYVDDISFLPMSNGQYLYLISAEIGEGEQSLGGTFDPTTGVATAGAFLVDQSDDKSAAIAPFGNLWADNQGQLDCFDTVASALAGNAPSVSGLHPSAPNEDTLYPDVLTIDSAGNVWYAAVDQSDETFPTYVGYFSTAAGCSTVIANPPVAQFTLSGDVEDYYPYLIALPSGGIAIQGAGTSPARVFNVTAATAPGTLEPVLMNLTTGYGGGFAVDGAGTLFGATADYATVGDVESLGSVASAFTTLFSLPPSPVETFPYTNPYNLNVFSPTNGAADRLMYDEYDYTALGLVENLASPQPQLVGFPNAFDLFQGAYGAGGAEWVPYVDNNLNVQVARVLPTTTWSVPNLQIAELSCRATTALFSILERGDSGPFTLSIPTTGFATAPLPGVDHDFFMDVPAEFGSFTAQVTDSHGRTESFAGGALAANGGPCAGIAHRSNRQRRHLTHKKP